VEAYHFDSIGVPTNEEMIRLHGSGEGWQRAMTHRWLSELASVSVHGPTVLEGQMRLSFIYEAIERAGVSDCKIILIDCSDDVRRKRLLERNQPELATREMLEWAAFLRRETVDRGDRILDTSFLDIDQAVAELLQELNA
jgi:hypothetical protein